MSGSTKEILRDVATVARGTVPAKPTDTQDGTRFFGIAEISAGGAGAPRFVDLEETGKRPTVLRAGDVVVALLGSIGQSALVGSRHDGAVLGRECALIRPSVPELTGPWIYVWTQSAQFRNEAIRHTSGTTMPRLGYKALSELTIPIPPIERQRETERMLSEFDSAIAKIDELRACLAELKSIEVETLFSEMDEIQ